MGAVLRIGVASQLVLMALAEAGSQLLSGADRSAYLHEVDATNRERLRLHQHMQQKWMQAQSSKGGDA
jgi:hypothetical protein